MADSTAASPGLQTRLTSAFPETAQLTREDLQALVSDDYPPPPGQGGPSADTISPNAAFFEAFFHKLPRTTSLYNAHADLLRANESKAQRNLALQPALEELRKETLHLFERAKSLEAEWAVKEKQLGEARKRFHPNAMLFGLTQSAGKLNDETEELANAYVEGMPYKDEGGVMDEVAFVRRYKQQRLLYHKRRLVADRWARGQVHLSN